MLTYSELYSWFGFNQELFHLINGFHNPTIDQLMLLVTTLGHPQLYPFYIMIVLVLKWYKPNAIPQANIVTFSVSYIATSVLIVPYLKSSFDLPRPLNVLGEQNITIIGNPDLIHSFPSGHSAFAILMAASLFTGSSPLGKVILLLFAILVCVSRISVGAHFPADIIGSLVIALPTVFIVRHTLDMGRRSAGKDHNYTLEESN